MIVNYDPKSFIVQAPGRIGREKYCGELVFVEIEEEEKKVLFVHFYPIPPSCIAPNNSAIKVFSVAINAVA